MNYTLIASGYRFKTYEECSKLLLYSASQSDYVIDIESYERLSPYSPVKNIINLTGSSKKVYQPIIIDFDSVIKTSVENAIILSPSTTELTSTPDCIHYWAIMGSIFKIINDLSPAYVTGYLLERNMKKELEVFNTFLSRLPFAVKVAINELMTDID